MTPPRTRIRLAVSICAIMISSRAYSQHLSSSRSFAMAAALTYSGDVNSLDWNPAGLIYLKEWDLTSTAFYGLHGNDRSLGFQSIGLGRKVVKDQSFAFRISPGISSEFIVPASFTIGDSSQSFTTTFEKRVSYDERFSFGYSARFSETFSAGVSVHYFDESITDTKYTIDTSNIVHSSLVDYSRNILTFDVGGLYLSSSGWRLGGVIKDLLTIMPHSSLPSDVEQYALNTPTVLGIGIGYTGFGNIHLGIDADTKRQIRLGGELQISPTIQCQSGMYIDAASTNGLEAISLGISTLLFNMRFEAGYLAFLSQSNRHGSADISAFKLAGIRNIEYNPFTSDRLSVTATMRLGIGRAPLAHIEHVDIARDIFPPMRHEYALQPVGKALIRNISASAIVATVSLYVDRFMDAPTQSADATIASGEVAEVPLYAVFTDAVATMPSLAVREADVTVRTSHDGGEEEDRYQVRMLFHGKNDWNGDVGLLKYFVTSDDTTVVRLSRSKLNDHKLELDTVSAVLQHFTKARILFDEFAQGLMYIDDPRKSEDVVQYPAETLSLHGGDCDDMSVCYAALLASVGIPAMFVDVKPPEHPDNGHVYLLFDTGIVPKDAQYVSDNAKRYVIRRNERNEESVWIPVETTAVRKGFEEAWSLGAREYYDDAEIQLGLVKGWMRLFEVQPVN